MILQFFLKLLAWFFRTSLIIIIFYVIIMDYLLRKGKIDDEDMERYP